MSCTPSIFQRSPIVPVVVSASQTIDGTTYTFDASLQRQRPGLLDSQGKIFAGFGSFCDLSAPMTFSPPHLSAGPRKSGSHSRGWLLGWDKATLALELPHELTNRLSATNKSPCVWELKEPCYLSSIWMSGFGLASDSTGDIYFTTGNTAAGTYDSTLNIAESAVRISSNLTRVVDFFTPSNHDAMDTDDYDYGSGGLMVLPDQPGPFPHLAAGAGKDGRMFLLNRDSMGGLNTPDIPSYVSINGCWCGPSYFESSEGPLVVSSGGTFKEAATGKVTDDRVRTWALVTSGPAPKLVEVASSQVLEATGQNPGFFTSVSSDGTAPNTAIIWAVGRAAGTDHHLTLYAFDATPSGTLLPLLWSGAAGSWPNTGGNANIIPTVADGRVFVASNQQLQIFGLVAH
jgi:hypothetical protein